MDLSSGTQKLKIYMIAGKWYELKAWCDSKMHLFPGNYHKYGPVRFYFTVIEYDEMNNSQIKEVLNYECVSPQGHVY